MTDRNRPEQDRREPTGSDSGAPSSGTATRPRPAPPDTTDILPRWKVLLHNDDVLSFDDVITAVTQLTPLNRSDAKQRCVEAHNNGVSLLLTTHRERAELYAEQFASKGVTVTIEPES